MKPSISRLIKKFVLLQSVGVYGSRDGEFEKSLPADISDDESSILKAVAPFTMTSIERQLALCRCLRYITENAIAGDFVECGVWKGGSAMIAGFHFKESCEDRCIWLYDNFLGMPPSDDDKDFDLNGQLANIQRKQHEETATGGWCQALAKEVSFNMQSTGYPMKYVNIVEGDIMATIPSQNMPKHISLLRLDTDWYASTMHELIHLYPLVSAGGFVVIDDYGHWQGAKKAVDEYFKELKPAPYLHRVDYTGRILQKPYYDVKSC